MASRIAPPVRDFLHWASEHDHCRPLHVPGLGPTPGAATSDDDRIACECVGQRFRSGPLPDGAGDPT